MSVIATNEQDAVPVNTDRLAQLATFVLADQNVNDVMELTVSCITVDRIAQLNTQYMDKDGPTDVLAFPLDKPTSDGGLLGDVVICPAVAASQAADHGRDTVSELDLLCVHGVLHVLGYDHAEEEEKRVMFALTDQLLEAFGKEEPA